jgi:hypothetical protein
MPTVTEFAPVKVGDIFASSWGYDQTNVDFYEVVGVTASGKSVRVVPIGKDTTYAEGYYTKVTPVPGSFDPDAVPVTKRVRFTRYDDAVIKITSYASAYRVSPDVEKYETALGYGR